MTSRRILITGATGLLGRTLLSMLDHKRNSCVGLSRTLNSKINNVPIKKCDITDYYAIQNVIKKFKPSIVIHLASLTGNLECEEDPERAFSVNVHGTFNVLNSIKNLGCRIIFSSSREVYGVTLKPADENKKLNPMNVNGITKEISENLIVRFHKLYNIPFTILRFTNFYSPHNPKRGISVLIKNALDGKPITLYGGNQVLNLINIHDAANAVLKSLEYDNSGIFNIGSTEYITPNLLIKKLETITKKKIKTTRKPYRPFEIRKFYVDTSHAKKKIGFRPEYSLETGLREFVNGSSHMK